LRNCTTRDKGRSFEVSNQVLISSHRKLLLSAARRFVTVHNRQLDIHQDEIGPLFRDCRQRLLTFFGLCD